MLASIAQFLSWVALWIALTVALLALAAWATGSAVAWAGVGAFLAVTGALWLLGRAALWIAVHRQRH